MKNLTWQNPEQLFVAQVLINKVKSKCCGIKDKYVAKKKGKTFGEVLKSTWKMAKLQVSMKKAMDSKSQPLSGLKSACKAVSYDWSGVTEAAVYPDNHRGYLGSKYCGD